MLLFTLHFIFPAPLQHISWFRIVSYIKMVCSFVFLLFSISVCAQLHSVPLRVESKKPHTWMANVCIPSRFVLDEQYLGSVNEQKREFKATKVEKKISHTYTDTYPRTRNCQKKSESTCNNAPIPSYARDIVVVVDDEDDGDISLVNDETLAYLHKSKQRTTSISNTHAYVNTRYAF